jgi:hypothetical protein
LKGEKMFKQAIKTALKNRKKTYQWLSDETGIPMHSIRAYMSKCKASNLSIGRVEKIFEVLELSVKVKR